MSDAPSDFRFPRERSTREQEIIDWLLPDDRTGYRAFKERLRPLFVIGEGRWGRHDYVFGAIGQDIDREAGMRPVVAFGRLLADPCDVTVSIHEEDDEGRIEMQIAPVGREELPDALLERARWTYSTWDPGAPCPASGARVREVLLPNTGAGALVLAIAPTQHVVWLHNAQLRTNTLVPVSNFYNELMIAERIRDPKIVFDHALLFREPERFTDARLIEAFLAYNARYRKVPLQRFDAPPARRSWLRRLFNRGGV